MGQAASGGEAITWCAAGATCAAPAALRHRHQPGGLRLAHHRPQRARLRGQARKARPRPPAAQVAHLAQCEATPDTSHLAPQLGHLVGERRGLVELVGLRTIGLAAGGGCAAAAGFNCTLKPGKEKSSTDKLLGEVLGAGSPQGQRRDRPRRLGDLGGAEGAGRWRGAKKAASTLGVMETATAYPSTRQLTQNLWLMLYESTPPSI